MLCHERQPGIECPLAYVSLRPLQVKEKCPLLMLALTGTAASLYLGKTMYYATYRATAVSTMAMAMCMCSSVPVGCAKERRLD
jgi:hypothetical protein